MQECTAPDQRRVVDRMRTYGSRLNLVVYMCACGSTQVHVKSTLVAVKEAVQVGIMMPDMRLCEVATSFE